MSFMMNDIMMNVVMLNVIMLNAVTMNVNRLSVVAPGYIVIILFTTVNYKFS